MGAPIVSLPANESSPDGVRHADGTEGVDAPDAVSSGRPAFDRRGTTVWEWQTATGVYSRDASTTLVQRLQAPELSLEKTAVIKQPEIVAPKLNKASCGGFNPYDHVPTGKAKSRAAPPPLAKAPVKRPSNRPVVVPPARPTTLLGRLRALLART
jgi:hypothetical protein